MYKITVKQFDQIVYEDTFPYLNPIVAFLTLNIPGLIVDGVGIFDQYPYKVTIENLDPIVETTPETIENTSETSEETSDVTDKTRKKKVVDSNA